MKFDATDNLCVNTLRTLSIDMVGQADSGHPGLPLGASNTQPVLNTNGTPNLASTQIRSTATTSRQIQLGLKFIW